MILNQQMKQAILIIVLLNVSLVSYRRSVDVYMRGGRQARPQESQEMVQTSRRCGLRPRTGRPGENEVKKKRVSNKRCPLLLIKNQPKSQYVNVLTARASSPAVMQIYDL